jgi:hypothetical protein
VTRRLGELVLGCEQGVDVLGREVAGLREEVDLAIVHRGVGVGSRVTTIKHGDAFESVGLAAGDVAQVELVGLPVVDDLRAAELVDLVGEAV